MSTSHSSSSPPSPPHGLLRQSEQAAAGGLVAIALVAIAVWCLVQQRSGRRLIDIEQTSPLPAPFLVDINEAPWPELALLPGIGPQLAQRIVADREARGPFRNLADLRRVKGIGPVTLERMRPYLRPLPDQQAVASGRPHAAAP